MITPLFENIQSSIIRDLSKAKIDINIAIAWFTNHEFFETLLRKLEEGLEVNLIIINDSINNRIGGLNWQKFINSGGNLYFCSYPNMMHHKFCIIDSKILYNGSYNWTYSAECKNKENTIKHTDSKELISRFHNEFIFLTSIYKKPKRIKPFEAEEIFKLKADKVLSEFIQYEFKSTEKTKKKFSHLFSAKKKTIAKSFTNQTNISKKSATSKFNDLKREIIYHETKIKSGNTASNVERENKTTSTSLNRNSSSNVTSKLNAESSIQTKLLQEIKQEGYKGKFGSLRINLKWHTKDDLDLSIVDPKGRKISYQNTSAISQGSIGKLDIDANASETTRSPQENIFWGNNPPEGYYKIYTTHFKVNERKNVPFVLSIISKKGKSDIISGNAYSGEMNTKLVAVIHYSRVNGITSIVKKGISMKSSI
jgi:hypothetical protein